MITIILPTMNRPDFLERLLRYYAAVNFQHSIFIGDASDSGPADKAKTVVAKFKSNLNVEYHGCPGLSIAQTVAKLNQSLKTPYAVLTGDDDFLVPAGIGRCVDFLKRNPS